MTQSKAERGLLLHQKLRKHALAITGYDHDSGAIALLAREYGIDDIVEIDLSVDGGQEFPRVDVVVCADIIEHVNSVGALLQECRKMIGDGGELILSTINALSVKQSFRALMRREPVHPDHVAYYSFGTLGSLLARFGFEVIEFRSFSYPTVGLGSRLIFGLTYKLFPQSADGIIMVARVRQAPA